MDIHGYTATGYIDATIDGERMSIPDDMRNRQRRQISDQWESLGNVIPPYHPEPEPPAIIVVYAVDLWSRMTNVEAEAVEAAMATQPVRIQNIFRAANSYRSDHELWPLLVSMATGLFGAPRAAVILAAS